MVKKFISIRNEYFSVDRIVRLEVDDNSITLHFDNQTEYTIYNLDDDEIYDFKRDIENMDNNN